VLTSEHLGRAFAAPLVVDEAGGYYHVRVAG
jgi:hypothetical protein